jgi:hypothetical protein
MRHSPKFQRFTAGCVAALLSANAVVLVVGLADASGSAPTAVTAGRAITLLIGPDGKQRAVDPTTAAGWTAIADAQRRGDRVVTVQLPADSAASTGGTQLIPGINTDDLQKLLTGKLDEITTTVLTTLDGAGHTVVSIVDKTGATITSIANDTSATVTSIVDDTSATVTSIVNSVPTTLPAVPDTTIPTEITTPTTTPVQVTTPTTQPVVVTTPTSSPVQVTVTTPTTVPVTSPTTVKVTVPIAVTTTVPLPHL